MRHFTILLTSFYIFTYFILPVYLLHFTCLLTSFYLFTYFILPFYLLHFFHPSSNVSDYPTIFSENPNFLTFSSSKICISQKKCLPLHHKFRRTRSLPFLRILIVFPYKPPCLSNTSIPNRGFIGLKCIQKRVISA